MLLDRKEEDGFGDEKCQQIVRILNFWNFYAIFIGKLSFDATKKFKK